MLIPSPQGYGVYTSKITPLNPPDASGETGNLVPSRHMLQVGKAAQRSGSPIHRGGLGCGKTLVNQLFQTCAYTVAPSRRET
ncbi:MULTISPECIES: hypothetical protein [unclassified Nostoc]|uniref:hypothetical protein n=1 Tax=unclassified Nostoc TaxID=2593658 RepID=UPI002620A858|nr:hypothetical protein [Nostoc sp. S13]MDF5739405.1 hypothetical protein [Nostoc sp. S13]